MLINEVFGWLWIIVGITLGMYMGIKFKDENWLGGYSSHPRRMIRLAHIACVALGMFNILFALSFNRINLTENMLGIASGAFIAGAVTMPICCGLMAWKRIFWWFFPVPVIALFVGTILTFIGLTR